mgnify:CR=1 FL=1
MANVVVVESPAKAKTIEKYLGKDFKVLASYGHVRDLLEKDGAVDPEHGYLMKYTVAEDKEKHINAIASALKKGGALYLATDPDREGEAISWHLQEVLGERGLLKDRDAEPEERTVRFRTVGDMSCTGAVRSHATSFDDVVAEIAATRVTERGETRADDRASEAAMEDRKRVGYF